MDVHQNCGEQQAGVGLPTDFTAQRSCEFSSKTKSPTHIRLIFVHLFGVCLMLNANSSDAGQLETLYNAFLAGPGQPVFVAFDREILVPKREFQDKEIRLSDGRVIRMRTPSKDFFGMLKVDDRILLSYSLTFKVTSVDTFNQADTLQGFDGNEYWSLSLNNPIKMLSAETRGGIVQTNQRLNRLRIVPRSEVSSDLGGTTPYIPTANLVGLLGEGLLVSQLGCSRTLERAPTSTGSWLLLSVEGSTEPIRAKESNLAPNGLPKTIEYPSPTGKGSILVELSQEENTITITRRSGERDYTKILYHILAAYQPQIPRDLTPLFSWKAYQRDAGPVKVTLRTNHSDFAAEIADEAKLEVKRPLPTSVAFANLQHQGVGVRRTLVLGSLALLTTVASVFLFRSLKTPNKTRERN